jgi:hypothetical protein
MFSGLSRQLRQRGSRCNGVLGALVGIRMGWWIDVHGMHNTFETGHIKTEYLAIQLDSRRVRDVEMFQVMVH